MKKLFVITLIATGFFAAGTPFVHAQSEAIKEAREAVISSVNKLSEVGDRNLSPAEKEKKEISLRKEALERIVTLSILETDEISLKLVTLTKSVPDEFIPLHNIFISETEEYLDYLALLKRNIRTLDSAEEISELAGSLKAWRETTYNPEIKKMVEFILAFQNKLILEKADERLKKINQDIKRLGKENSSENLVQQAAVNLEKAHRANESAMEQLKEYIPRTDAELSALSEPVPQLMKTQALPEPPTVRERIEDSLLNIRKAYKNFIEINDSIK
jgi:hypothetical protein